jgi:DNA polymerase-3 subunit delta
VAKRDRGAAIKALAKVYDPQDRGLRLVGVLAWQTRQLLKFEAALRAGLGPQDACKAAGAPPFKARDLSQQVRSIPRQQLETWLPVLSGVDRALKGGSKRPPKAILEHAVLELCRQSSG